MRRSWSSEIRHRRAFSDDPPVAYRDGVSAAPSLRRHRRSVGESSPSADLSGFLGGAAPEPQAWMLLYRGA